MSKRKHKAYTLWMKWQGLGWTPEFTIHEDHGHWSPIEIIKEWLEARGYLDNPNSYWQQGKTWMIKPLGEKPAELLAQEKE